MHKQLGCKTGETSTCAMFGVDGNGGLFPVAAGTPLGRNYFCCHPHWSSTSCCFSTASDIRQRGLWWLSVFCPASASQCVLSLCTTTDTSRYIQPASWKKENHSQHGFQGTYSIKCQQLQRCRLQSYSAKPVPWHWRLSRSCRSQKGVVQLQQALLKPSSWDTHMHARMSVLKLLGDLLQPPLVRLLLSPCFNKIYSFWKQTVSTGAGHNKNAIINN